MPGASHALQEGVDGSRRADLAHEIDIADVDAELERGRRHQRLQLAALQALLRVQAPILRKTAVMRGDMLLAHPLRQMPRHALGQPARVHEHQRGAVLADELGQPVVDLASTPRPTSRPRAAPAAAPARDRAARCGRHRRWCSPAPRRRTRLRPRRPENAPPPRSASASPTIRCASGGGRRAPAAARATAPDAHRACCRRWRESHRRSRCGRSTASRGPRSEVSRMYSDSGVVTTMCGGVRRMPARSLCGVSPVRTTARIATSGSPAPRVLRGCPRAAPRDCAECRSTAPSAARRRRCASHRAARPRSLP